MILRNLLGRRHTNIKRVFSLFNSGKGASEEGIQSYASIWNIRAENSTKILKMGTDLEILESLKKLRGLRFGFKMSDKNTQNLLSLLAAKAT